MVGGGALDRWAAEQGASVVVGVVVIVCVCVCVHAHTYIHIIYICCCSVAKLCPTLCDPMGRDCSTPGSPVLHYLLEFVQIHIH